MSKARSAAGGRPASLQTLLPGLPAMDLAALRSAWREHLHQAPPACRSPEVLRGALAWNLQAIRHGGLSKATRLQLRQLAERVARGERKPAAGTPLMPGTILTREWHGKVHRVVVGEDGFLHEGRRHADLSAVARAITGTRWSGPRFFGLRRKVEAAADDGKAKHASVTRRP